MIQSSYSLAFNGKALLNNSKEMLWQRNIYQVTTATDGHGTMTASPMSGFSGLPCGYISQWGNAVSVGNYAYFRTPDATKSYATVLMLQNNGRLTDSNEDFDNYFNIRLIKDT